MTFYLYIIYTIKYFIFYANIRLKSHSFINYISKITLSDGHIFTYYISSHPGGLAGHLKNLGHLKRKLVNCQIMLSLSSSCKAPRAWNWSFPLYLLYYRYVLHEWTAKGKSTLRGVIKCAILQLTSFVCILLLLCYCCCLE